MLRHLLGVCHKGLFQAHSCLQFIQMMWGGGGITRETCHFYTDDVIVFYFATEIIDATNKLRNEFYGCLSVFFWQMQS